MPNDLRSRAAGRDVATTRGGKSVAQLIEAQKAEMARALPKHLDPDRLARIAVTVVKQTPKLAECDSASLLGALMTCAQLGLEPGPLGEAYLVPYGRQVTFIPGYRGLIKLAWQSGQLRSISAETVHANDTEFSFAFGLHRDLRHVPAFRDRGEVTHVYAAALLKDGGEVFVVLTREDVEAIRKRSKASSNGPWVTDWNAMAKKTAVRQLSRWLPMSTELATAARLDGSVRSDATSPVEATAPAWLGDDIVDGEALDDDSPANVNTTTGEMRDDVPVEDPPSMPSDWPETAQPGTKEH